MCSLLLSIGAVALAGLLCGFENSNTRPTTAVSARRAAGEDPGRVFQTLPPESVDDADIPEPA